jgi:hypothetical protein
MEQSLVLSGAWRARWLAAADLKHARQDAAPPALTCQAWHAGGRGAWCAVNPVGGPASKPISQCAPARAHACIGAGGPERLALAAYGSAGA